MTANEFVDQVLNSALCAASKLMSYYSSFERGDYEYTYNTISKMEGSGLPDENVIHCSGEMLTMVCWGSWHRRAGRYLVSYGHPYEEEWREDAYLRITLSLGDLFDPNAKMEQSISQDIFGGIITHYENKETGINTCRIHWKKLKGYQYYATESDGLTEKGCASLAKLAAKSILLEIR